jgi:3-carboxy-cis,cis-muconate cycloisomerase
VPVGALVAALREAAGDEAASWVHWGATSQDIVDTALVLSLREVTTLIDNRLADLVRALLATARRHAATPMLARTRSQAAVPTSFGLKAAGWAAPLQRHRARLAELTPRLLVIQLGGAAGTRSVLGDAGAAVSSALARELGLGDTPLPWHNQRDAFAELAGWFSLVTGSLGKLGQDILLLAQSGIEEVQAGDGSSSTMPHKANPVSAELLVALARHNANLLAEVHQALVHGQERDGAAWSGEWLALPQMAVGAGAALSHATRLIDELAVDRDRMAENLAATNGLALAEAAAFALTRHMPRREAELLVKSAAQSAGADGGHLLDHLARTTDAAVDWDALKDPDTQIATAVRMLEDYLAATSG